MMGILMAKTKYTFTGELKRNKKTKPKKTTKGTIYPDKFGHK